MTQDIDHDALYFTPFYDSAWHWSADQEAIEWLAGGTIVLRSELELLIQPLVSTGLLPLDSLLLIVAACRRGGQSEIEKIPERMPSLVSSQSFAVKTSFQDVMLQLQEVARLPADLRETLDGRRAILSLVVESYPRRMSPADSQRCYDWLQHGEQLEERHRRLVHEKSASGWSAELRGLTDGLMLLDELTIRTRMKTGLPALPQAVPQLLEFDEQAAEQPQPLTVHELLKMLEADEDHAGIARLSRRLNSIIALPRPVEMPDEQPAGGVADITNRGPFDRLLLSELAHDPDVLMTRVALNEALYVRREVPPSNPLTGRVVLMDIGLRMWGLPRVFGASVALSLAQTAHGQDPARLFTTTSHGMTPVDLTQIDGCLEFLGRLNFPLHPGSSLAAFAKEGTAQNNEVVLVTHEDVFDDRDFQAALCRVPLISIFVVTVNGEGDVRLLHRSLQGTRTLRQARLDLKTILTKPQAKRALVDETVDPHLPHILKTPNFPLLLHHQIDWDNCGLIYWVQRPESDDRAMLSLTYDQRLTLWNDESQGPVELSNQMPTGRLLWHSTRLLGDGYELQLALIIGILQQAHLQLVIVELELRRVIPLKLPKAPVLGLSEQGGVLYVMQSKQMTLFSTSSGKLLGTVDVTSAGKNLIGDKAWLSGRFFHDGQGIYAVAFDGQRVTWHQIYSKSNPSEVPLAVFDCACLSSPIIVQQNGSLVATGSVTEMKFKSNYTEGNGAGRIVDETQIGSQEQHDALIVQKVAPDGGYFVLQKQTRTTGMLAVHSTWLVDLTRMTARRVRSQHADLLEWTKLGTLSTRNLRNRLSAIAVRDRRLILLLARGSTLTVELVHNPTRLTLVEKYADPLPVDARQELKPATAPAGVGFELRKAEWPDGSRVYLDSRGLLHLVSSDPRIPELSLVLHDTDVAGWCSKNYWWGQEALTGRRDNKVRVDPAMAFRGWLTAFVDRLK